MQSGSNSNNKILNKVDEKTYLMDGHISESHSRSSTGLIEGAEKTTRKRRPKNPTDEARTSYGVSEILLVLISKSI